MSATMNWRVQIEAAEADLSTACEIFALNPTPHRRAVVDEARAALIEARRLEAQDPPPGFRATVRRLFAIVHHA